MKAIAQKATLIGTVVAAVVGSVCCLGPIVLALLGFGGASALLSLGTFRPVFIMITVGLLLGAFYLTYRKKAAKECKDGEVCDYPGTGRVNKIVLWLVTAVALLLIFSPEILALFV